MRRLARVLGVVLAVAFLFVGVAWLLLPERFAVNGPMVQLITGRGIEAPPIATLAERLTLPARYRLTRFAEDVGNARMLRVLPGGDVLVSRPRAGEVVLLERDANGDGRADGRRVLLGGLDKPHGVDFAEGWLYVAEGGAILRTRFDPATRQTTGSLERIVSGLPAGGNHWSRTVRVGPDRTLYVTVGSSCNVCVEDDPRRAAMLRFAADGTSPSVHATGLRNSVGFDWQPGTGDLYATDNGRDLLGDDLPPEELNQIRAGAFYGWPIAYGARVPDPDHGAGREADIAASIPPAHGFRAHNAPLGMTFLRTPALPGGLTGRALVALHGSWNRTVKDGYIVVSLEWQPDGRIVERPFLSGFHDGNDLIGRPVDVAEDPGRAIYVSDDYAGSVYRITWDGATADGSAATRQASAGSGEGDPVASLDATERERITTEASELYERFECASCHEAGGSKVSGKVPPLLDKLRGRYTVDSLAAFLAAPQPPMPLFPLSDDERRTMALWLLHRDAPQLAGAGETPED